MRNRGVVKYESIDLFSGNFLGKNDEIIFTVKKIDESDNLNSLCNKEKYWIKEFKTYVGDFGTKYGYNQTRGGETPGVGSEHPSYKEIDPESLKELIRKGYNSTEIGNKLGIQQGTVGRKTKEFWDLTLPEARVKFGGEDSFNERASKRMRKSAQIREISDKGRMALSEARIGENNPRYINIDEDSLRSLIEEGLSVKEIAELLQVNYTTVYDKIHEFWKKNSIIEMRELFGVKRKIDLHPQYIIVDKSRLKQLILEGYNSEQIADLMNLTAPTTVWYKIKEFWNTNLTSLQKRWNIKTNLQRLQDKNRIKIPKQELKKLITEGRSLKDIASHFKVNTRTIYSRIKEYWGTTLTDLRSRHQF